MKWKIIAIAKQTSYWPKRKFIPINSYRLIFHNFNIVYYSLSSPSSGFSQSESYQHVLERFKATEKVLFSVRHFLWEESKIVSVNICVDKLFNWISPKRRVSFAPSPSQFLGVQHCNGNDVTVMTSCMGLKESSKKCTGKFSKPLAPFAENSLV